jgi:nucleoside-diphosphate-sugar epimerase
MEDSVMAYTARGVHIVLVHPTRVYGPGVLSQANSLTKMIDMYLKGKWRIIPGNGRKIGNYVYIDDVVKGHLLAMEKGNAGEKYILGGSDASYNEFFRSLAEVSGKKFMMIKFPRFLMAGISSMLLTGAKVFGGMPLITPALIRKYLQNWSVSSQKAQKELGYTSTPLKDGLQKTIEWLYDKNRNE